MDQQTIVTLVVGLIVTVLGFLFRYVKPLDPLKSWLEMGFSIVGSVIIALAMGKLGAVPGFNDPVATIQYFLESAAVVFAITQIVYNLVKQAFPDQVAVKRVFTKVVPLLILAALALSLISPIAVFADAPADVQPWMYAASNYGLGSVADVQTKFTNYQYAQAAYHKWTPAEWQLNYAATVTQFLNKHGCASCFIDGTTLSYKLKIDVGEAMIDYNLAGKPQPD